MINCACIITYRRLWSKFCIVVILELFTVTNWQILTTYNSLILRTLVECELSVCLYVLFMIMLYSSMYRYVQNNEIANVSDGVFQSLSKLTLMYGTLVYINTVTISNCLFFRYMSGNYLTEISSRTFAGLNSLETLYVIHYDFIWCTRFIFIAIECSVGIRYQESMMVHLVTLPVWHTC